MESNIYGYDNDKMVIRDPSLKKYHFITGQTLFQIFKMLLNAGEKKVKF